MEGALLLARKLFDKWNANSIRYCHWKSNEHLMEGLEGKTDLDVLVCFEDRDNAEKALIECGYKSCKSQYGSRYPFVEEWIGQDDNEGKMIHIHLHYRIVTGHKGMKEYNLPWTDLALDTRILDAATNVYITDPSLEIVILYSRIGLKASIHRINEAKKGKFKCPEDDKREIEYLKKKVDWAYVKKIVDETYKDKASEMMQLMKKDELSSSDFLLLESITNSSLQESCRNSRPVNTLKKYYFAIALRIRGFIKNRCGFNLITRKVPASGKGLVVAFIGQDGAGKSTVTDDIVTWLNWKIEAKKFYLGSGEHYHSWQKKMRSKLPQQKNAIASLLSAWLTLSDYVSLAKTTNKSINKAEKYAAMGGVAIFDRFPQTVYPGINDGPKIRENYLGRINNPIVRIYATWCANREERFLDKATAHHVDVVFKLILSPEESIRRKPEENYDLVKRKHEIIKSLEIPGAITHVIDASQPYSEEIKSIKNLLWKSIY